jgi:hypothetical protein
MAKVSEIYSGQFLTAVELPPGRRTTAVIFSAEVEMIGQGREQSQKIVLSLTSPQGRAWPKSIVLNKTNSMTLAAAFGDDTDAWAGKSVVVWSEPTTFAGKRVQGIRIDVASQPAQSTPTTSRAAAPASSGLFGEGPGNRSGDDLNDEIPF